MNMGNTFKRILAMVLALTMVLSYVPFNTFATETETGTETQTEGTTQESQPVADGEPDAQAETEGSASITGTITENTVWEDGAVIGGVTISGNVTITVKGTVTVAGTIRLSPDAISNVVFNGENDAKLIRGGNFAAQMLYVEGVSGNFQNLTINNITLDGGAVWTGDVDKTLNRGTTNSGILAKNSAVDLRYANVKLNNSVLQNHDNANNGKASAVYLRYYSSIEFNSSVVRNNNSQDGYNGGGVISVREGGTVKTNNAEVYGNSGAQGGFYGTSSSGSFGGVCEVYNSKFHNNFADAGAVFDMQCNSNKGYLKIDGCEFYENASGRGLIYEHAYSRPVIIKDSYFHDNECAVWDCHTDPVLDISGKIVVEEDADYTKYLFETPLVLTGALAEGSSIAMSEASITKLGGCIFVGNGDYVVTESDMAKLVLPEGYQVVIVDVTGDGIGDAGAVKSENELTEVKLTLKDNADPAASAEGTVYSEIDCLPVNPFAHDGLTFAGWVDAGGNAVAKQKFTESATLTVIWKIEAPVVTLGRKDQGANINTLVATITNKYDSITYTYQWYKDGDAIEGATSSEYTITKEASYKCVVTASLEGLESVTGEKSATASPKEVPKNYVAQVGDDKFETLAAAITAAQAGDTITFLADITEDVTVDEAVIIDGADKTYTGKMSVTASVTIKNVNFDGKGYNGYAVETRSAAAVVIEDCTAKSYGYGFLQVVSNNNTLTVKNVTVSDCNYGVKVDYSNAVVLENVKLDCAVAGLLNSNYGKKTITIKASDLSILGTWTRNNTTKTTYVFEGANSIDEFVIDEAIDVFKLAKDATLTAPNEIVVTTDVENGTVIYENGAYSVLVDPTIGKVAEVNGEYFATLQAAVEAANAIEGGATVTLLADVTLGKTLTISGNVIISGAYTITRGKNADDTWHTGTLFEVDSGATLTLDGGLVVDGANEWVFDEEGYNAALKANDGTLYAGFAFAASEEGAPVAKARMFVVDGSLVMNSVTVQNHMGNNNCGLIGVNDAATLTLNNGATLKHNATSHSSVVAYVAAGGSVTINDGVLITGNYYAKNGGIFQSAGLITMNGGEISHNVGVNTNGTAAMMAQNNAKFVMNGGLICSNSSVRGSGAGRNAAIYLHSTGIMEMNGGSICHNIGCGYGGIDTNQTNSKLTITGGYVGENVSLNGNATADVNMYNKELVAISGGSYTQDVSQWLAPNTGLAYDEETGVYAVVTEKLYKLHLTDPATGEAPFVPYIEGNDLASLVATGKSFYANYYEMELEVLYNVKIDKTVVIDYPMTVNLNGKTLTAATGVDPMFRIESDVVVTGEGKLDARNGEAYVFILGKPDGTKGNLTIENGTFYGETTVASVTNGKLTINGGKFAVNPYVVEGQEDNYNYLLNCIDANYKNGTAVIEVKGGVFFKFDPSNNAAEGAGTSFMAEGYEVSVDGDYYTVNKAKVYVAQVGETKYETLAAAIAAAQAGDTVTLIADITEDVTVNKSLTIDGANFKYTGNISVTGTTSAVTVKNVNFVDGTGYAITTNRIKSITVENCTVSNYGYGFLYANKSTPTVVVKDVTVNGGNYGMHWVYGTSATLEKVTMTGVTYGLYIQNYADKTVTLKNCDISSIEIWERTGSSGVQTFNFEGENTVGTLSTSQYAKYVLTAADATLTAPEGATVTTSVEGHMVSYADGTYSVCDYIEWIKAELLAGNDVTLDRDIVVDASYVESIHAATNNNGEYYNPGIFNVVGGYGDGVATFDLKGHTITYNGHEDAVYDGTKYASNYPDGIINSCTVAHGLFFANNGGKLTVIDSSEEKTGTVTVYGMASAVWSASPDSVITVEGGTWTNNGCATCGGTNIFLYASHGGELYITGGTFEQALDANGDSYLIVEHGGYEAAEGEVVDYSKTKVEITGGTFVGMNPEEAHFCNQKTWTSQEWGNTNVVAKGYKAVDNGDSTWTVVPNMIFEFHLTDANGEAHWLSPMRSNDINSLIETCKVWYDSLQGTYNFTLKILEDYELDESVQVTFPMTLDLNGKTIAFNADSGYAVISVASTLTLVDSSAEQTGKIVRSSETECSAIAVAGGNLTVKSGTIESSHKGIQAGGTGLINTITIEGGVIKAASTALNLNKGTNTVSITGGKLSGENAIHASSKVVIDSFTISGGEFVGNLRDVKEGDLSITGGTFTVDPSVHVAEGYIAEEKTEGYFTVREVNYVAQVGETKYESFTDAVAAAEAGDEIILLATVKVTEDLTLDLTDITVKAGESCTYDLFDVRNGATLTINGGTFDATASPEGYAIYIGNNSATRTGNVVINGGTFVAKCTVAYVACGKLTINGGNFSIVEQDNYDYKYVINCHDGNYSTGNATVTITGGTFVGFNPEDNAAEGEGTNFLSGNYKASDYYDNDTWYVAEANVVMDGDKYFATIKDALAILTSADTTVHTVKVLQDLEIDVNYSTYNYPILVNGFAIELDLNGKTLTADWSKYTGTRKDNSLIGMANGGKLTVVDTVGGGTIRNMSDGKDDVENRIFWLSNSHTTKETILTIEGGTFIQEEDIHLLYVEGNKSGNGKLGYYVYIKGGDFQMIGYNDFFNSYDGYEQETIISGGTFNVDPTDWETKFPKGYKAEEIEDGTWTVVPTKLVKVEVEMMAGVWGTSYITVENWADLEAALGENTNLPVKVTLLADVELTKFLTITGDKTVELNLNGYNITREGGTALYINGENTTVNITGEGTVSGQQAVYVNAGKVTINGGAFHGASEAVYVINNGHAEIYGGTFSSDNVNFVLNEYDKTRDVTTITVYGGTFVGFNPENNAAEGAGTNFVTEGYEAVDNGNGTWSVVEKKTEVEKNFQFGQTSQIWLIEPWALRANLYVYHVNADGTRGAELTAEELAQFDDYGVYFIRESDLGIADATQDNITVDDIINNENVIVKTMQNGCSIKSDKRNGLWADFDEGIYTYQLSDSVFVLYYIVVDGETIYAPIRERNLSEMVEAGITDTVNYKESERAIFAKMHQLEIDILEYRGGAHDTTLEIMDAPTLGQNPIGNAAEHNLTFGHTTAVSLIEPWGIQLNGRVTLDKEYDDYGVIVFYDTENEIDETVTAEMLLAMENAYVFSYANGDATIEVESDGRTRITALYNSGLYTYQMKRTAYVMFYVKDGDNIYCGPVKERSIESAILSRLNVAGVADTKEGKVLQDMLALYEVTAEHRGVE